MPFLEVFDFGGTPQNRGAATELMTDALCRAYEIDPTIVSAYFIDVSGGNYGHAGKFGDNTTDKRIFIKVHAFRRSDRMRRVAARNLTDALAQAYQAKPKDIAVYFFDRDEDQVSHGGVLASD
jgi:phenylpyruvate tautomerase PptA (4-oxalocrotonate tautomerase family)